MTQIAKLFMNGGSQALRLPAEFRFDGSEVNIQRDEATGGILVWRKKPSWEDFVKLRNEMLAAGEIPEDFLSDRNQLPEQKRDLF